MLKNGNTVGSQAIRLHYSARKHQSLQLTQRQMSIVLGSIIGDAYIYPQGKICFEQAASQKSYLFWKYAELKTLAYPKVAEVIRLDKRTNTTTTSWRFFLRQYFRPLRKSFYRDYQKILPKELSAWFSPLTLAVWYMDDGYLDSGKYPQLMSESFVDEDVRFLTDLLEKKFLLKTSISAKNRIRIQSKSSKNFFQLISPHIHTSMNYKLP